MTADPYRWPDSTDILGQLRDAQARIARVQALMEEWEEVGGRGDSAAARAANKLRTALGGDR